MGSCPPPHPHMLTKAPPGRKHREGAAAVQHSGTRSLSSPSFTTSGNLVFSGVFNTSVGWLHTWSNFHSLLNSHWIICFNGLNLSQDVWKLMVVHLCKIK